ncbi:PREDICTED: structural maintenance of chromosomes protein 4 [Ceratosolen solmsi marchali]|uniref:Structural maintenance of chromosomes protein n=1 Tax=Ceratosolen solmsi marchali TaxID=326594 RepID=A0AAJ7E0Q4_9HYME|nr:PREDICTED: structural maintenance of chromosomes protein 4 [Ceratosolen solmsi marchali]
MTSENLSSNKDSDDDMEIDSYQQVVNCENDEEGSWRVSKDIYIPPPPQLFGAYDAKGPRLMINRIVAKNFKSYAGTIEIGPFHKYFSSIVGPNGNGKSNAIDSMLFVFGYRANKIRSKKITELIHNSNEHPNCNSCTVSVYFQQIIDKHGQDYDVIANSEFFISRTAFKDGTAFYEINGKKVQFKQIAQILRSHCIDLDHNRFLILQGEVEQIALMKPKGQSEGDTGMLEFLEDIIGTNRYKEPLEKLFQRVEFLSELREKKLRRLKVIEKAKGELEKPMQEAVQYLKVENNIIKLQHKYYQCKRYENSEQLAKEEKVQSELVADYTKLTEEMKTIHKNRDEKTKDFKEKSKKWDKLQQEKETLSVKFEEIRKKDEGLFAESVATNKRRKDNINTVKAEKNKLEDLLRVPVKNLKDIEECEDLQNKYMADREKEEAALVTLMSGLKEKTEPLMKKRSKLEKELVLERKNVDEAKSDYEIAKSQLDLYTSEEQNEKMKFNKLQESFTASSERLVECKKKLTAIDTKVPATEKSLQHAQKELDDLKVVENEVNERLRNTRIKYDEQKSAMQAGRSRNHILNSLMTEKREGRLPGIFGRLGDLGAIDVKFDVAISTACGPLDNIVVDTVNTATECIKFLRDNDIGRATFIALEKQQRFIRHCQEKIRTPENVHRLFDLIKVEDKRVLPAFYYAIQNTLVANDLDQATRIAYGARRHRVVTLKGELIELSGTMSGGGRQVSRGRMGQRVARSEPTVDDIEKLQFNLDELFGQYNKAKAKQQPLENQIHTLSTALKDMIIDKDKLKVEINHLNMEIPNLSKQLKEQEKKAASSISNPEKVKQLLKIVKKTEDKLKSVSENSKTTEKEVDAINQEIEEISGGLVKDQQKKILSLTRSIDKIKGEICRLQVAIKTSERNSKKTEQRIATLEEDIKNCENRIRVIQTEKAEFEEVGKDLISKIKQLNEDLAEKVELADKLKADLEKLQSRESKMKAIKIDLDQKLNDTNKVVKELKNRIPELTKSIESMKLQEIPNEENEVLEELTKEDLDEIDSKSITNSIQKAKEKLPKEIPNMQIIEQFKEQNDLYIKRSEKLQKITETRNSMRDTYNVAVRKRMQEFNTGFNLITGKLKEMYRMITLGGDAELELVDSLDPFSEGIVFSVRPPKKSWKYIQNLSGGEKTLSSLALVFALHHYKPTPIYFMDEIDAALDFKNVSIVASYIKERTKNAQFIVISHRSDMFELADYLVGVYKIFNCSKCAVVDVRKFNSKVGISEQNNNSGNLIRSQFLSQPNPIISALNANSENRTDAVQSRTVNLPATCPENINRETEGESSNENNNQTNENEDSFNLRLGDISLPSTPIKRSSSSSAKKQKPEKNITLKKRKSLRKSSQNELHQVSESSENHEASEEHATVEPEIKLRRTPRNIRKEKFVEETTSPGATLRKRRRQ